MPVTVEYAVMVREEDQLVTRGQCLGNGDVSRSCRSSVCLHGDVFHVAVCQRVLERAGVIHDVDAGERLSLIAHAVKQSKQALQVPLGADMAWNDQCARH